MDAVANAIAAALLLVPVLAVWYLWRMMTDPARVNPDVCEECGYDLRGSPARCPECGAVNERHARHERLERLRSEWPAEPVAPREPAPDETLVVVYEDDDAMLVDLLCEQLEARGFACRVKRRAESAGASVPTAR